MAPLFSPQIGAGQAFNSQFLQHGGPRGPSVPGSMNPTSVGGLLGPSGMNPMGMNPTRAAGMAPLYAGQRLPQHGYPGPPQAQPLPRQVFKRAYSSEVSVHSSLILSSTQTHGEVGHLCERSGHASWNGHHILPGTWLPRHLFPWHGASFRFIQDSSTCQEASTDPVPPSTRPVPGRPLLRPPTLGTGCPCSRVWASPCPPLAQQDCTTR